MEVATKKTTTPKKVKARVTKAGTSAAVTLESAAGDTLRKLRSLGIEEKLQADIEWCLGSYAHDGNPAGLHDMLDKALAVLKEVKAANAKAVAPKLLSALEAVRGK